MGHRAHGVGRRQHADRRRGSARPSATGPLGNEVAITFDDGPDATYTLDVRDILDAHGVKATFFTVGKALDARPDISRALLEDGQLLGDHSYHHDYWRWLTRGTTSSIAPRRRSSASSACARRSSARPTASARRSCR